MNRRTVYYIAGGSAVLLIMALTANKWKALAASVIASFESFSATPYWDVSRWSWGYGTAAPGPTGTISRTDALKALQDHVTADYNYLASKITRALTPSQWAAYMDFSYNEGAGAAAKLVDDINAGDDSVLENHWKEYIYAGGVINNDLIARRDKEWLLWSQNIL